MIGAARRAHQHRGWRVAGGRRSARASSWSLAPRTVLLASSTTTPSTLVLSLGAPYFARTPAVAGWWL